MSTWHRVMADGEEFMRWKISTNTVEGYKTDTKCAHSVHGRPTLKDEESKGDFCLRMREKVKKNFFTLPLL